jgi:hypothetical protein
MQEDLEEAEDFTVVAVVADLVASEVAVAFTVADSAVVTAASVAVIEASAVVIEASVAVTAGSEAVDLVTAD